MTGYPKIEISREDLENLSTEEIVQKYGCHPTTISLRRKELGVKPRPKRKFSKPVPTELSAKWFALYREGLTARLIYARYPDWGYSLIRETLQKEFGSLKPSKRHHEGW